MNLIFSVATIQLSRLMNRQSGQSQNTDCGLDLDEGLIKKPIDRRRFNLRLHSRSPFPLKSLTHARPTCTMTLMTTNVHDFAIEIEKTEDGYFVHAYGNPFGEARDFFVPPFSPEELEQFTRLVADVTLENAALKALQQQTAREFGERLFRAIFRHNVLSSYHSSYQLAYQQRAQLRIRIQLPTTPEFMNLPWEYLYDPVRDEFLALSNHSPLVRYTNLMHRILPLPVETPLRMLVVIPSPDSYPTIHVERQWLNLLDTLDHLALVGKMKLERLQKPTLLDLQRRLRQGEFHILHFIGHARFDSQAQDGLLVFEDEMGRSRLVSGQHFGALLRDHYTLRLVSLNASAGTPVTTSNPYLAVATNLVQRALPAVVATQFATIPNAALAFANVFYSAIADRQPVDAAAIEARRAVQVEERGVAWGASTLIMRTPDGRLFEGQSAQLGHGANVTTNLTRNSQFVTR